MNAFANISIDELRELYEQKMKQEILAKYHFPLKPTSDGYYYIYVADPTKKSERRAVKAKTLDELKEKVYQYEKGMYGMARKTFREVFEITQDEKLRYVKDPEKRLSVQNTVGRNETEYRRYFAGMQFEKLYVDEISKKDIENICMINLSRYNMTKKAFLSMRGILKAVFRFAFGEYWITNGNHF